MRQTPYEAKVSRLLGLMDDNPDLFRYLKRNTWFREWLQANLHLYDEFERYAIEIRTYGKREHYGARVVLERMRWDTLFQETDPGDYKINDHCTPYLARLAMLANPQLEGMFELRARGGEDDDPLLW